MKTSNFNSNEQIEIQMRDGGIKKVEVIFRFRKEDNGQCYIVYKYKDEYFAAKYDDVIGISGMDTNMSSEEIQMLELMLNNLGGDK